MSIIKKTAIVLGIVLTFSMLFSPATTKADAVKKTQGQLSVQRKKLKRVNKKIESFKIKIGKKETKIKELNNETKNSFQNLQGGQENTFNTILDNDINNYFIKNMHKNPTEIELEENKKELSQLKYKLKKLYKQKKKIRKKIKKLKKRLKKLKTKYSFGVKLQYSKSYHITSDVLTPSKGVCYFNGHKETYYSQRVLPGGGLRIPGRHVANDGTIRDKDGYICIASNDHRKGSTLLTSLGPAKVYDCGGMPSGTIDIYVDW